MYFNKALITLLFIIISQILLGQTDFERHDNQVWRKNKNNKEYSLISINNDNERVYVKPKIQDTFFNVDTVNEYFFALSLNKISDEKWKISKFYLRIYYISGNERIYHKIKTLPRYLRRFFRKANFIVENVTENNFSFACRINTGNTGNADNPSKNGNASNELVE